MLKKITLLLMAVLMISVSLIELPIAIASDPPPTHSYESKRVDLKRLGPRTGILMYDDPVYPRNYSEAQNLIYTARNYEIGHTGFSVEAHSCHRDANTGDTRWILVDRHNTSNAKDSGSLIRYKDQITRNYSSTLISHGINLNDVDWTSLRGELRGVDHWSIYSRDTRYYPCREGDEAIFYNDNDILMEGWIQLAVKDPSETYPSPNRTEGAAKGKTYWELRRYDENKESGLYVESQYQIAGDHFATRNPNHRVSLGGQTRSNQGQPINLQFDSANALKGQLLNFEFSYEYTNHYRDIYSCASSENGHCYSWVFVERIPDWDYVKTFKISDNIIVDHRQGETEKRATLDNVLSQSFVVGREIAYNPSKSSSVFHEQWKRKDNSFKNHLDLKTQTTMQMTPGKWVYQVELPSGKHKEANFYPQMKKQASGVFKAAELDESLQDEFINGVKLQQKVMKDLGMSGKQRAFESDFVSDLFFTTHYTGFMSGYPYANKVQEAILEGKKLEDVQAVAIEEGTAKGVEDFEEYANGVAFEDEWLFTAPEDFERLQRYAIPVSPKSKLYPGETYENKLEFINLGLSDLKFMFSQTFSYEHYLFGSGYDEAWIIEQPGRRFPVEAEDVNTIMISFEDMYEIHKSSKERTEQRMHNFRFIDRSFTEVVKEILGIDTYK